jgi:hypothetical protein
MSEKYKNRPFRLQYFVKDSLYHNLNTSFIISINDENSFQIKNTAGALLIQSSFNEVIDDPNLGKLKVIRNIDILDDFNRKEFLDGLLRGFR